MFSSCFDIRDEPDSTTKSKDEPIPNLGPQTEVIREFRDLPPIHYLFKIQNFSDLLNAKTPHFESSDFQAAGYNWRLKLSHYPKGSEKQYLSLYLRLSDSKSLPTNKEIDVYFKLFVYNRVEDKYLTVQGSTRRFCGTKTEWGFDELLPLDVFQDESNGYLFKDRCVFGAEIFVLDLTNNNTRKGESVSIVKELGNNTFTWNIPNFEKLKDEHYKSDVFAIGGHKWSLTICPNLADSEGNYLSAYLYLEDLGALNPGDKLKAEYVLRVKDQLHGEHHERLVNNFNFSASAKSWGYKRFMPLSKLNDTSKGYIMNGSVIVEVQISLLAVVKELA